MANPLVLLLAGSPSDLDLVLKCQSTLEELGLPCAIRVQSAHRTPDLVSKTTSSAEAEGFKVIIAFAGMAAHLAGVAAAHTRLPVIAVPVASGSMGGIDAALASLQMPPGTPVATVAVDGARNAALLAGKILGVANPEILDRLSAMTERDRKRYDPEAIEAEIQRRRAAKSS